MVKGERKKMEKEANKHTKRMRKRKTQPKEEKKSKKWHKEKRRKKIVNVSCSSSSEGPLSAGPHDYKSATTALASPSYHTLADGKHPIIDMIPILQPQHPDRAIVVEHIGVALREHGYFYAQNVEAFRCPSDKGDPFALPRGQDVKNCYADYGVSYLIIWSGDHSRVRAVTAGPGGTPMTAQEVNQKPDTKIMLGDWPWISYPPHPSSACADLR